MGRVAIVIGDSARTVAPGTEDFTKYTLTFSGPGVHADVDASGGSAEVELSVGEWTITATGYTGEDPDCTAVAEGSVTVTVSSEGTQANIPLKPKTSGVQGTFSYALTTTAVTSRELIISEADGTVIDTITLTNTSTGTKDLDPGQYLVRIRLQSGTGDSAKYAGLTEVLHIYSGMTSTLTKDYTAADFNIAVGTGFDLTSLVTAPVKWAKPVTTFSTSAENQDYTGSLAWRESNGEPAVTGIFAAGAVYKAVLTLTARSGFTFIGVAADSFSYTGATSVTNTEDSGEVTITFAATETTVITSVTVNEGPVSLDPGSNKTFTATVAGSDTPPQGVTWTVTGGSDTGTVISSAGKLNVALNESGPLTVKATAIADNTSSGTATVTVNTAASVINIADATDLAKIGADPTYPLYGKYKLTASFTLSNWSPIGTLDDPFVGVLDGNNQTITLQSFHNDALAGTYIGIFGYVKGSSSVTSKAGIKDLTIASSVSATSATGQAIGLLAGYVQNTEIDGIVLSGSFGYTGTTKVIYIGGIVGIAESGTEIKDCSGSMTMAVSGGSGSPISGMESYNFAGGFVGLFQNGVEISNCHNTGDLTANCTISGSQVFAGGIAGGSHYAFSTAYQGSIQDSSSTGNISAKSPGFWTWVGGIAGALVGDGDGALANTSRILRCFASGTISVKDSPAGYPYVGGIVGYNYYGALVSQSYFTGDVIANKANDYVGGIAGYNSQYTGHNSRIEDCWSSGTVMGFNNAGGIVGQNQINTYIRRCYSTAIVSTTGTSTTHTGTGGIAGLNASAMTDAITSCFALNPSITSATTNTGNKVHRVSGTNSSAVGLKNNSAWSGMILTNGGGYTMADGADLMDGASIAILPLQADYVAQDWQFPSVWKMGSHGYPILQWQTDNITIPNSGVGIGYGAIVIGGDDGANVISKSGAGSKPTSITLTATNDYTNVKWYVDGSATAAGTENSFVLAASSYSAQAHSITFTGTRNGALYSKVLAFTVKY
jgi:hypothetical protein